MATSVKTIHTHEIDKFLSDPESYGYKIVNVEVEESRHQQGYDYHHSIFLKNDTCQENEFFIITVTSSDEYDNVHGSSTGIIFPNDIDDPYRGYEFFLYKCKKVVKVETKIVETVEWIYE